MTILAHPLAQTAFVFILVFTIVFGVLQKSKLFGEGKKQIDALVALVIGLIVVSFSYATGIIISIIPFLAVAAVIILIFMLIYGMTFKAGEFKMDRNVQITIAVLAAVGLIVVTLFATGAWDYILDLLNAEGNGSSVVTNLVFLAVVVIAIVLFMFSGKKGEKKD